MLTYISTEPHGGFKPLWHGGSDEAKQGAREVIASRLAYAAKQLQGDYLFRDRMSVADCYLFVMVRWTERFGIDVPEPLLRAPRGADGVDARDGRAPERR